MSSISFPGSFPFEVIQRIVGFVGDDLTTLKNLFEVCKKITQVMKSMKDADYLKFIKLPKEISTLSQKIAKLEASLQLNLQPFNLGSNNETGESGKKVQNDRTNSRRLALFQRIREGQRLANESPAVTENLSHLQQELNLKVKEYSELAEKLTLRRILP